MRHDAVQMFQHHPHVHTQGDRACYYAVLACVVYCLQVKRHMCAVLARRLVHGGTAHQQYEHACQRVRVQW